MDIKQKEVAAWLCSLYGDENSVPEYEITSDSVDLLHHLMTTSQQATLRAQATHADYLNKANEYNAKGAELGRVLAGVGLSKAALSKDAHEALTCIAATATAVGVRSPSEAALLVGYSRLEAEQDKVMRIVNNNKLLRSQLVGASQQLSHKLEHIKSLEEDAEVTSQLEEQELHSNSRRRLFHEKKLQEYQGEIRARQSELQYRGYSSNSSHDSVMRQHNELRDLQQQEMSLLSQLDGYSLPPSVTGARLAVEQTRQELADLMEKLATQQDIH